MNNPSATKDSDLTRFLRLSTAVFSIVFFLFLELVFRYTIQPSFSGNMLTKYDPVLMDQLRPLLLLYAALPSLFVRAIWRPSYQFVAVINVFVYIPILVCSPSHLGQDLSLEAVSTVFLGMMLVSIMSNYAFPMQLHSTPYLFWSIFIFCSAVVIVIIAFEGLVGSGTNFVTLANKQQVRENLNYSTSAGYAIHIWTFCLGPIWIATIVRSGRYVRLIGPLLVYVLAYGISAMTTVMLAPIWVLAVYVVALFNRFRYITALFFMAIPLVIAVLADFIMANPYDSFIGNRLYSIHGQIFANYFDFFDSHPYTWFSHIRGMSMLVPFPFDKDVAILIGENYPGGNQNANFWAQDAIAGAGIWAIPFVSATFGFLLIVLNSISRQLPEPFLAAMLSMEALRFADGAIGTAILTGGLGLMLVLLATMPRAHSCTGGTTLSRLLQRTP